MFGKNKNVTPQVENAVAKAVNYEVTVADIARRSEKRAWMVAFASVIMSLILAGGYFYFLPLKEKVPYLVMADAYTGQATVARLRDDFSQNSITANEAINKSNISHFVAARESYDFSQIGDRDWATVYAMGAPQVTKAYSIVYSNSNPQNPITLFGKSKTIRVRILSIQLHSGDSAVKSATVRFQRTLFDKDTGNQEPMDSKIAAIEYTYKSNLKMDDANRVLNPLGFQVSNYRVDNDFAPAPPPPPDYPVGSGTAQPAAAQPAPGAAPAAYPPGTVPPQPGVPQQGVPQQGVPQQPGAAPAAYPPGTAPQQPGVAPAPNPAYPAGAPAAPAPAPTGTANGVSTR
ncbi:type IV secretion system protein [Lysobacter sp. K5869]|uniref:virB8 family protein n=1 Tax=Lysobacter sp. K5869 TaxID=2820808 RepID=UPI001C063D55|nr:type IV secretion system protein [Lysobacter sp. K5869]QWP75094.1 type IV secretion system protein [Lysobacter sp. K5869]